MFFLQHNGVSKAHRRKPQLKLERLRLAQPVSPQHILLSDAPISPNTVVHNQQILDTSSITSTSPIIMPRSSPGVELATFLRSHNYLDCLILENMQLQQLLQMAMLMMSRQTRSRRSRGISKRDEIGSTRTTGRIYLPYILSLLQYQRKLSSMQGQNLTIFMLLTTRYLDKRIPLPKSFLWLTEILPNSPDHIFEAHSRMTRRSFGMLVETLKTKASSFFTTKKRGRKQLSISAQLHLAIFTLGFYGNGANFEAARVKFGYSVGSVINARRRVVNALVSLMSEYIKWPTVAERRELCIRAKKRYGYRSAFFTVDGTAHPFAFVPGYQQNVWYDRKSRYSMQALVTNDIDLRVRHIVVGWPGSTHDARVMASAEYMKAENEEEFFDDDQHGLGDAAFGLHRRVIPNYKEPLASLPDNIEYNRIHSSMRIKAEHTIGHVKNRFQGLREVRLRMKREKDVAEVVKYITAGYVLHNMLLDFEDNYRPSANRYDAEVENDILLSNEDTAQGNLEEELNGTAAEIREKVKEQVLRFAGYL